MILVCLIPEDVGSLPMQLRLLSQPLAVDEYGCVHARFQTWTPTGWQIPRLAEIWRQERDGT